jgi:hypothetical protein
MPRCSPTIFYSPLHMGDWYNPIQQTFWDFCRGALPAPLLLWAKKDWPAGRDQQAQKNRGEG